MRAADDVFVGIDNDRTCVSFAVERVGRVGAENSAVVFDEARSLRDLFAPGEIDVLHVNFPYAFPAEEGGGESRHELGAAHGYRDLLARRDGFI